VVLRLQDKSFHAMRKRAQISGPLRSGQEWAISWTRTPQTAYDQTLPAEPIAGRLIAVRLSKAGFRPLDLYLFTSLSDAALYPIEDVVALYGLRWQVELSYRHIKTTLEMEEFNVQTAEMFRKELAAGLLTYNLICALMVKAAVQANLAPGRLSFSQSMRRIRSCLTTGVPAWVVEQSSIEAYLMERLGHCRLAQQAFKVQHEPRKVRQRPQVYPVLKGERHAARQEVLKQLGYTPPPDEAVQAVQIVGPPARRKAA
jgi:hypothetical protein